jgi:DNA polymerase-3 subunit alpha
MANKGFAHLHLHSQYSLLDGAIRFEDLFYRCKELGMDSVALTDHGNLFGAIEFYTKARKAHIKPIIGIEAYVAPRSRFDRQKSGIKDSSFHIVLLAENTTGYHNLLKLASIGYTEGFYYRPRIDKEILSRFREGLICTSACLSGEVGRCLINEDFSGARKAAESYLEIFGDEQFFIEIQEHQESDTPKVRGNLIELANQLGVGLAATNDVHFLNPDDYQAHHVLCCISTGKKITDEGKMEYPPDVYLKSPKQMREMFSDVEQACDNTLAIAERCNVEIDLKTRHAPNFVPDDGSSPEEYLTRLCYQGAKKRYGKITPEIEQRLKRELEVIEGKGFSSYFLIVWDFCNYAMKNNIPVGARGSGVGTIVGYCLRLCDVDPIKYDLLFERFMDPERNEMPDIDIDICQDGRGKVIDYVRNKYGDVAQIITFGTMKARAVIRDVCRVLDISLSEADRFAKLVPPTLGMTLDKAIGIEPELAKAINENEQTQHVFEIARKLEGLTRHASVHAAGVVISQEPLTNFVPLYKQPDSDDLVTQFEGPTVEQVGLLKMDFLGLRTLSVIERTIELVHAAHDIKIDIESIEPDDPKVLSEIFGSGRTKGVFQFESGGMQDLLMKLRPDRFEDLIAANALYRPGPMALIPDFIDRKHGAKWDVPHPIMKEVLEETFGIMVYQEQVMRICNRLGDIPLRQAYTVIKAIGKKKLRVIARAKEEFVGGCVKKGLKERDAEDIFELIKKFAGYGFNKSHATRYSLIAYQTAYLKAYWPVEFMAALLTFEMSDRDKVVEYINECKEMDIAIQPPDINESFSDFTVIYSRDHEHKKEKGLIRFGLTAVKGVGEKAVEQIIASRQEVGRFKSLYHFCENVDLRAVNKQVMEALIKAGAFDSLKGSRAQMMAGLEKAMQIGTRLQADKQTGQMNLFGADAHGGEAFALDHESLPNVGPWPEMQMLTYEKEVLGFYVTKNPLSQCAETISAYSTTNTGKLCEKNEGRQVVIGGMVTKIRNMITRNGRNAGAKMAVFTLEDLQGNCEVVMFPRVLADFGHLMAVDKILFVKGKVDCRRENPNIICEELIELEQAGEKLAARVWMRLTSDDITEEKIARIRELCSRHRGKSPVHMSLETRSGYRIQAIADKSLSVRADVDFRRKLEKVIGPGKVQLTG